MKGLLKDSVELTEMNHVSCNHSINVSQTKTACECGLKQSEFFKISAKFICKSTFQSRYFFSHIFVTLSPKLKYEEQNHNVPLFLCVWFTDHMMLWETITCCLLLNRGKDSRVGIMLFLDTGNQTSSFIVIVCLCLSIRGSEWRSAESRRAIGQWRCMRAFVWIPDHSQNDLCRLSQWRERRLSGDTPWSYRRNRDDA